MASLSEAGRSSAASLCLHSHDNTAQWALTTFQMEMEYPVKIRHTHLDGTSVLGGKWEMLEWRLGDVSLWLCCVRA